MKNLILTLLFSVLAFSNSSAQEGKINQKAAIKTPIYCDHCSICETFGMNLQSNILKIKGVRMYELDEKSMILTYITMRKKPICPQSGAPFLKWAMMLMI